MITCVIIWALWTHHPVVAIVLLISLALRLLDA